ncbi:hypothetical protein LG307_20770 [Sutcliffiella horikoshii]
MAIVFRETKGIVLVEGEVLFLRVQSEAFCSKMDGKLPCFEKGLMGGCWN